MYFPFHFVHLRHAAFYLGTTLYEQVIVDRIVQNLRLVVYGIFNSFALIVF